ncbi:MAG: RagB/SusD family nutrient uptake outer membrane protein [Cyclobacteriaceae bacterium]
MRKDQPLHRCWISSRCRCCNCRKPLNPAPKFSRDWAYLYSIVGKANRVINNVELVPDPALTAGRKQQIKGEASFIRAYANFDLVRLFGDVPLVTQEVRSISAANLEEIYPLLFPDRVSADHVYDQIIADLEFALGTLGITAPDKGYATAGAVNALLAKVYATREPHLIVVNDNDGDKTFGIKFNGRVAEASLPGGAVGTFVW